MSDFSRGEYVWVPSLWDHPKIRSSQVPRTTQVRGTQAASSGGLAVATVFQKHVVFSPSSLCSAQWTRPAPLQPGTGWDYFQLIFILRKGTQLTTGLGLVLRLSFSFPPTFCTDGFLLFRGSFVLKISFSQSFSLSSKGGLGCITQATVIRHGNLPYLVFNSPVKSMCRQMTGVLQGMRELRLGKVQ